MSRYHSLPIAQKRAESLARVREPAVSCPICDTQVMPVDLIAHVEERCSGPREPGKGSKWLTWREALDLGVSRMMLSRWARSGKVRARGLRGDRQYLARDLQVLLAYQRANRRRQ